MKNKTPIFLLGISLLLIIAFMASCLKIVLFEAPNTAQSGSSIYTKVRIKADETAEPELVTHDPNPGFKLAWVLSIDPSYDKQDVLLKTQNFNNTLLPSGYFDYATNLTIPANTFAGKYYLLAIVNDGFWGSSVNTYRDQLNVFYRPITITGTTNYGTDIAASNVNVYSNTRNFNNWERVNKDGHDVPTITQDIAVVHSSENRGQAIANGFINRYYLVKDNRWYLLGTLNNSAMSGNSRQEYAFFKNIRSYGFQTGYAALYIFMDHDNYNNEANETNNYAVKSVYISSPTQGIAPPESNITSAEDIAQLKKALIANNLTDLAKNTEGGELGQFAMAEGKKQGNVPFQLTLSPNPTSEKVTVSFNQEKTNDVSIQLFDVSGKMIHSFLLPQVAAGNYQKEIPLNALGRGIYIVKFQSGQQVSSQKLVVE